MIIYPICSSSKGNSTYISSGKAAILIDVGVGLKTIYKSLDLAGLDKSNIKAIFITHEHSDHVCGLYGATKILKVPVFSSKPTLKELIFKNQIYEGTKLFEINVKVANIYGLRVGAFKVSHDSVCGLRYNIWDDSKKISICTDFGFVSNDLIDRLKDSDFILLESNYDEDMLKTGKYPAALKRRIMSKHGHLCNMESAKLINVLIEKGVKKFLLGHLSLNNNTPQLALKTAIEYLMQNNKTYKKDYDISVAPAKSIGKYYEI